MKLTRTIHSAAVDLARQNPALAKALIAMELFFATAGTVAGAATAGPVGAATGFLTSTAIVGAVSTALNRMEDGGSNACAVGFVGATCASALGALALSGGSEPLPFCFGWASILVSVGTEGVRGLFVATEAIHKKLTGGFRPGM